ncbi:MAG: iron ABC transporter permease [Thermoflexales bacterium]|nr:iron ABC transporter permease [Thermoflexales bacterium]MDW8292277.1 iron ABC transporter permease [Anaerolineae bacterium]
MRREVRSALITLALAAPALSFLLLFFAYPLGAIARVSFTPSAISAGLSPLAVVIDPRYLHVLAFSVFQAALSTALTLLAGLPIAFSLARYRFPSQSFWRAVAVVPFVMPPVVTAAAFSALLGPRGWVNAGLQASLGLPQPPIQLQGSLALVLIAHVFYNIAVVVRIVGGFLAAFDTRFEEAAALLGANRWQVFRTITLPLALPAIGASSALVFLFTFTSFGVMLLLGGARFATLEVEIYRQTAQLLRLDVATSLALLQSAITMLVSAVAGRLEARAAVPLELRAADKLPRPRALPAFALVAGSISLIGALILAPMAALVARSLSWDGDLLRFYRALNENTRNAFFFVPPFAAIRNSLTFALIAATLTLAMGVPLAYAMARSARFSRSMEALLLLPIGTSAVTLGLGYIVAFGAPPLALRTSILITPLAHALIALPFVVRAILPAVRAFDVRLREAALSLGATPLTAFRTVELPLLAAPISSAAVFAFAISLGEFGASLLLTRPEYPTMTVAIFRFLGQPGALNYGQAMAMSTLLMLTTAASALLIERLSSVRR